MSNRADSTNFIAIRLRGLVPSIMRTWEDRVRAEVPAAKDQRQIVLYDSLEQMLEVMAKIHAGQTDPRTAARDVAFIHTHGAERADLTEYSLEQMILECQILQEVVLDALELEEPLSRRDRSIVLNYLGEVIRLAAGEYAREQTEHARHAQDEVRDSEERYRVLFDSIDEGFCLIEVLFDESGKAIDYRFLETNTVFEAHTGLHNAVGRRARELVPGLEDHWFEMYGKVALTGESVRFVNEARAMDERWFDVNAFRVGKPEGRIVALLFTDTTERKRAEQERERLISLLRTEHARLADLLRQAPAFVAIVRGPDYVFEIANPLYMQLVGYRDIIGKPVLEALPEVRGQGFVELLDQVYRTGEPLVGNEVPIKLQRQEAGPPDERYVNFVYQALREPDGAISGIFVHGVDVSDQVLARQELRYQAEELARRDRAKDEFLAMLGHELRNPLSGMSNALYLVSLYSGSIPQIRKPLETLLRQTDQLGRLVNDLLDVARITQGKIALQRTPLSLESVVTDTILSLQPQIHAKGLHLQVEMETDEPAIVSADRLRIEQVLTNLLTNAIKYSNEGTISISVRTANNEAVLRVRDTGVGIAPELLPAIFDLFTQVDTTIDRSHGGLGIGLTLVRRLLEMHGGRVEAESEGIGKGCTFTVYLPLAESRAAAEETARDVAKTRMAGLHVLVVDDNVDAAVTLGDILESWGHRTVVVHGGAAALNAAKENRPDLMLLDIGLPDVDGYEVARRVRDDANLAATTLVALTGYGQEQDRRRTRAAGFDHHLTKPVDLEAMQSLLTQIDRLHGFGSP